MKNIFTILLNSLLSFEIIAYLSIGSGLLIVCLDKNDISSLPFNSFFFLLTLLFGLIVARESFFHYVEHRKQSKKIIPISYNMRLLIGYVVITSLIAFYWLWNSSSKGYYHESLAQWICIVGFFRLFSMEVVLTFIWESFKSLKKG